MNRVLLTIILFAFAHCVYSQSARVKPSPSPTPRPRVVYSPASINTETTKKTPDPARQPKVDDKSDEVFRVESALVPIPAAVFNSNGRSVTDLRLEDFELDVDGKPAAISEISRSQSPVRLALLFDNSGSLSLAREFEKKAAIRFLKQVIRPDKDQAALFSISTYSRLEQTLTNNVSRLIEAIDSFPPPEGATALFDGIIKASEYLKEANGRRVIVIVSDGEDNASELESTLEKTVQTVQSANCQIYVVKTTDYESFKRFGDRTPNSNTRFLIAERRMQEISGQTGGSVYSPIDDRELDAAFTRISAELADQYILYHYPEDTAKGGFRAISLRVKTRNGVTVRTRKGYISPKSSSPEN